ncbi:MAG: NADPH-dependent F420 reductase [Burkholderiales bacterium]|nr:NADPH-dependent F420 reductase [Burkholderiales bacterium]
MRISIIGAGNVGKALAHAFIRQGEEVFFGVPNPEKYQSAVAPLGSMASLGTVEQAVNASEVVILAVPCAATEAIARSRADWQGKVLVDATNPLAAGLAGLTVGTTTSAAEQLASWAPTARVVKAFNTTGAENMADASFRQGLPFMPVCGDDAQARAKVIALAVLIGFDAVDLGPLSAARYLEPFAMTWIHMAFKQGLGRNFAFGILRKN